jgi:S-adenosylmethionine:tRNA ribosyltransferase-isomerase
MLVSDFAFDLPPELVAQFPPAERGTSRLLVLTRGTGVIDHTSITALPGLLDRGDLLVLNNTRVFPARLLGRRLPGGGDVECLLVAHIGDDRWEALVHPGQRLKPGRRVVFERGEHTLHGEILEQRFHGRREVRLWSSSSLSVPELIEAIGHIPLPPYIKRPDLDLDRDRYQTVFARESGSIAAPTAGLHFTPALLGALEQAGIERAEITLHVGYGTFKPVRATQVEDHVVDSEGFSIDEAAARQINAALDAGRRIVAVGTTTTRALESAVMSGDGRVAAGRSSTGLFIRPGHRFRALGALLTNFHLPCSSLLVLVASFAGRETTLSAYAEAVARRYRFYSYGDAMLIV